tara:strand:- start:2305 stop:3468 length:1164 start_codon:yes stop_codon:yes gene_type:complete
MEKHSLDSFIEINQKIYDKRSVLLHEPVFSGNEKTYLNDVIDSTYVSYAGKYVDQFEKKIATFTGAKYAVSTVNGTAALHAALLTLGVMQGDEVITQSLTFVATVNAIKYCGADPIFLDVDEDTMGLSPDHLRHFLETNTIKVNGRVINKLSNNPISCIMPMHTFGIPARITELCSIAQDFDLPLLEDSAEALGSRSNGKHLGRYGKLGVLSFNSNKIITTGGGGMIITDDENAYLKLMHITKTGKVSHKYEFLHDEIGYNYRLPNLNACVGVAQLERLDEILALKKDLAVFWSGFFAPLGIKLKNGGKNDLINNWLIAIQLRSHQERSHFLDYTNDAGVSTRPIWTLMSDLPMFKNAISDNLLTSRHLADTIVNIPSGVPRNRLTR